MSESDGPSRWYVYVIYEAHEARKRFSKIGITNDPVKRLRELQVGNPRTLRVLDYSRRPYDVFGYPCPSETLARQVEEAVHAELAEKGCGGWHDPIVTLDSLGVPQYGMRPGKRSEWFEVDPDEADKTVLRHWSALVDIKRLS